MSIVNVQALKGLGCVCHWPGQYAESGAYDDDGNKRGFNILPDGVTIGGNVPTTLQKCKDGRNVLKFNRSSNNYITIGNSSAFDLLSNQFTFCFWLKPSYISGEDYGCVFLHDHSTSNYAPISILTDYNGGNRRLLSQLSTDGTSWVTAITGTTVLQNDVWYFISVVRNSDGYIRYYINMQLEGSYNIGSTALFTSNGDFVIGEVGDRASYPLNANLKDEMFFKGKALSVDQLAAIMNETFIY